MSATASTGDAIRSRLPAHGRKFDAGDRVERHLTARHGSAEDSPQRHECVSDRARVEFVGEHPIGKLLDARRA